MQVEKLDVYCQGKYRILNEILYHVKDIESQEKESMIGAIIRGGLDSNAQRIFMLHQMEKVQEDSIFNMLCAAYQ